MTEPETTVDEKSAATKDDKADEKDDDESVLDDLIESIVEIPHFLFRTIFGKKS